MRAGWLVGAKWDMGRQVFGSGREALLRALRDRVGIKAIAAV